ncbi:hypothetical protein Ocin01_14723, partial [Orchesella cincta]
STKPFLLQIVIITPYLLQFQQNFIDKHDKKFQFSNFKLISCFHFALTKAGWRTFFHIRQQCLLGIIHRSYKKDEFGRAWTATTRTIARTRKSLEAISDGKTAFLFDGTRIVEVFTVVRPL